jgi:hypothetical protein
MVTIRVRSASGALSVPPNCERWRIHLRGAHNDLFSRIAKQEGVAVASSSLALSTGS